MGRLNRLAPRESAPGGAPPRYSPTRRGGLPEVRPGTVPDHEAVGEVVETGGRVDHPRPGDQVIVSAASARGSSRTGEDHRQPSDACGQDPLCPRALAHPATGRGRSR